VNVVPAPTPLENLLRMFNIHSVRDEWPLISIALSLRDVMRISGEIRESRLSEMTGLTRATVRRAKRLLSLPDRELELIQAEAHLDRTAQVHREDLYLEVEQAVSVIGTAYPEILKSFNRDKIIREFVRKRELDKLTAVTDFRYVGRLIKSEQEGGVLRERVHDALVELIVRPDKNPRIAYEEVAKAAYEQLSVSRRTELLIRDLQTITDGELTDAFVTNLKRLRAEIDRLLS
jgi:ParB family transcriptional regulator, chromosome partitioning protein